MSQSGKPRQGSMNSDRLDRAVADARTAREKRQQDYRAQSLKIHPWVCGRCGRAFTRENLQELTVHHKDHNHDNNPPDGSNWENLCIYCHENEHARQLDHDLAGGKELNAKTEPVSSHQPFAGLKDLIKDDDGG